MIETMTIGFIVMFIGCYIKPPVNTEYYSNRAAIMRGIGDVVSGVGFSVFYFSVVFMIIKFLFG